MQVARTSWATSIENTNWNGQIQDSSYLTCIDNPNHQTQNAASSMYPQDTNSQNFGVIPSQYASGQGYPTYAENGTYEVPGTSYTMPSEDVNGQIPAQSYATFHENVNWQVADTSHPMFSQGESNQTPAQSYATSSKKGNHQAGDTSYSLSSGDVSGQIPAQSHAISLESGDYQAADASYPMSSGDVSTHIAAQLYTMPLENGGYQVPGASYPISSEDASNQVPTTSYAIPPEQVNYQVAESSYPVFSGDMNGQIPAQPYAIPLEDNSYQIPGQSYSMAPEGTTNQISDMQNSTQCEDVVDQTAEMHQVMSPGRVRLYLAAQCLHHPEPRKANAYKKILYTFPSTTPESSSGQTPSNRNPTPRENTNSRANSIGNQAHSKRTPSAQHSIKIEQVEGNFNADDSQLQSGLSVDRVSSLIDEAQLERFTSPVNEPEVAEYEVGQRTVFVPDTNPEEFVVKLSRPRISRRDPRNGYGKHGITFMQPLGPTDFILRNGFVDPRAHDAVFMPSLDAVDFMEAEEDAGENIIMEGYRSHGGIIFVQHIAGGKPGIVRGC